MHINFLQRKEQGPSLIQDPPHQCITIANLVQKNKGQSLCKQIVFKEGLITQKGQDEKKKKATNLLS